MAEWIMVAITAVYVIATIVICYYNSQSARAAKKQTDEMMAQYQESHRPVITVYFDIIRSGLMCFIIENIGTEPAYNVMVSLNDEFIDNVPDADGKEALKKLQTAKMYVASKQKITVFIASQIQYKTVAIKEAKFKVTYNERYNEEIQLDLKQYSFMLIYDSPVEDISQHLKDMKEAQAKFQRDFLRQNGDKSQSPHDVIVHNAGEKDSQKLEVYKALCILRTSKLSDIAERCQLPPEETQELLIELMCVDHLVETNSDIDLDRANEESVWYRK